MNTEYIEQHATWKGGELTQAQVALVRAALSALDAGRDYFGPDDVPENVSFGSTGIIGSAVHALRSATLIRDFWGSVPDAGVHHGRRKSKRESANGRKVSLYQLTSR